MLEHEAALLLDILDIAERYGGSSVPSPLPEQAQEEPVMARAASHRPSSAWADRPSRHAAGARESSRAVAKGKSRPPRLGDLLTSLLCGHHEPRLAAELRNELLEKHPDRSPTPQVVRNTLESLVAKGCIRRHKQQRSVMYSPVEPAAIPQDDSAAAEA